MNRSSETLGTIIKGLTFVLLGSRRKQEWNSKNIFEEMMKWKHPKFGGIHKSADPRSPTKPKQQELKTIHTKTHHKLSAVNYRQRKNLRSTQRKPTHYYYLQGNTDVSDCGFSSEITEPRRKRYNVFKVLKENCQPRSWYPVTVSFWKDGVIKTFSDEGKPREFVACCPVLKELI